MWANSGSKLKAHPTEEARGMAPSDATSNGGSAEVGMNRSSGAERPFRWTSEAVRRLYQDVDWALTSNPTGAAEIAGVLLGKSGSIIEIIDCQPVLLMQERDHAYALTGPGRREFERTIGALRSIPGTCARGRRFLSQPHGRRARCDGRGPGTPRCVFSRYRPSSAAD